MIYRLNSLKRYNNIPRVKQESLAEHQFYIAIITMKLLELVDIPLESKYVLLNYVLIHDIQELYTGDIPHNVKMDNPELKKLIEEIEDNWLSESIFSAVNLSFKTFVDRDESLMLLFKLADHMQVVMYTLEEIEYGNKHHEIYDIYKSANHLCEEIVAKLKQKRVLKGSFKHTDFLLSIIKVKQ